MVRMRRGGPNLVGKAAHAENARLVTLCQLFAILLMQVRLAVSIEVGVFPPDLAQLIEDELLFLCELHGVTRRAH